MTDVQRHRDLQPRHQHLAGKVLESVERHQGDPAGAEKDFKNWKTKQTIHGQNYARLNVPYKHQAAVREYINSDKYHDDVARHEKDIHGEIGRQGHMNEGHAHARAIRGFLGSLAQKSDDARDAVGSAQRAGLKKTGWTDEAREAAAEARRRGAKGKTRDIGSSGSMEADQAAAANLKGDELGDYDTLNRDEKKRYLTARQGLAFPDKGHKDALAYAKTGGTKGTPAFSQEHKLGAWKNWTDDQLDHTLHNPVGRDGKKLSSEILDHVAHEIGDRGTATDVKSETIKGKKYITGKSLNTGKPMVKDPETKEWVWRDNTDLDSSKVDEKHTLGTINRELAARERSGGKPVHPDMARNSVEDLEARREQLRGERPVSMGGRPNAPGEPHEPSGYAVSGDKGKNPKLQQQMSSLRGGMRSQAEQHTSDKFGVEWDKEKPQAHITYKGKRTTVPLFAAGEVMRALKEVLPDEEARKVLDSVADAGRLIKAGAKWPEAAEVLNKAWSDEARAAALEARRAKAKPSMEETNRSLREAGISQDREPGRPDVGERQVREDAEDSMEQTRRPSGRQTVEGPGGEVQQNAGPHAILPSGKIDTTSGKNEYWDDGTNEVWQDPDGKHFVVHTAGDEPLHGIGSTATFRHDQTGRAIRGGFMSPHKMVGWFHTDPNGKHAGVVPQGKLPVATYK